MTPQRETRAQLSRGLGRLHSFPLLSYLEVQTTSENSCASTPQVSTPGPGKRSRARQLWLRLQRPSRRARGDDIKFLCHAQPHAVFDLDPADLFESSRRSSYRTR